MYIDTSVLRVASCQVKSLCDYEKIDHFEHFVRMLLVAFDLNSYFYYLFIFVTSPGAVRVDLIVTLY